LGNPGEVGAGSGVDRRTAWKAGTVRLEDERSDTGNLVDATHWAINRTTAVTITGTPGVGRVVDANVVGPNTCSRCLRHALSLGQNANVRLLENIGQSIGSGVSSPASDDAGCAGEVVVIVGRKSGSPNGVAVDGDQSGESEDGDVVGVRRRVVVVVRVLCVSRQVSGLSVGSVGTIVKTSDDSQTSDGCSINAMSGAETVSVGKKGSSAAVGPGSTESLLGQLPRPSSSGGTCASNDLRVNVVKEGGHSTVK